VNENDSFRLMESEVAGAIIGAVVAGLFLWDLTQRALERFFG
jgi:hypothetical protein